MDMSWAIVFTVLLLIAVAVIIIIKRRSKEAVKFDERQLLERHKAVRYSFLFTIVFSIICMFTNIFELKWAPVFIQFGLNVVIGVAIFIVICIFKDAYINLNYNKNIYNYAISTIALGVIHLYVYVHHIVSGVPNLFTRGTLSDDSLYLFTGLMFLTIGASLIIKKAIDKKGEAE